MTGVHAARDVDGPVAAGRAVNRRDADDEPVFVDGSGRRRRVFTLVGVAAGGLMALAAVAVAAALLGIGPVAVPGLPELGPGGGPAVVPPSARPSPAPSPSRRPTGNATAGRSALPSAGASDPVPASSSERRHGPPTDRTPPGRTR